jgi:hypothetical protein
MPDLQGLCGWAVLSAGLVVWSAPGLSTVLWGLGVGLASWSLSEYVFHRFVLHAPRVRARAIWRMQKRLHYKHHEVPDDPRWLFIPWWGSPGLIAIGGGVGAWTVGPGAFWPAALGYAMALVLYEVTHFAAHVPYRPRTRWGAFMKRHHVLHHYKNERYWYGVTSPLGDFVFGTWAKADGVQRSKTARKLAGEEG